MNATADTVHSRSPTKSSRERQNSKLNAHNHNVLKRMHADSRQCCATCSPEGRIPTLTCTAGTAAPPVPMHRRYRCANGTAAPATRVFLGVARRLELSPCNTTDTSSLPMPINHVGAIDHDTEPPVSQTGSLIDTCPGVA